jgi:type I restriction enzyme M protein
MPMLLNCERSEPFARRFRHCLVMAIQAAMLNKESSVTNVTEELAALLSELIQVSQPGKVLLVGDCLVPVLMNVIGSPSEDQKYPALPEGRGHAWSEIAVRCQSQTSALKAIAWLAIEGATEADVKVLRLGSGPLEGQYDCVIAAPPLGASLESRQNDIPVPTKRVEYAVFQRSLAVLKPGGLAISLMPRALGFSTGLEARRLRKHIIEQHRMESVIELPAGSAYAGVAINSLLLCVRHAPPSKTMFFAGEGLMKLLLQGGRRSTPSHLIKFFADRLIELQTGPRSKSARRLGDDSSSRKLENISDHMRAAFDELSALAGGMATGVDIPETLPDSCLARLRTGLVELPSLSERGYALSHIGTNPRHDLITRALKALTKLDLGVAPVRLGDVAKVYYGVGYDRKTAVKRTELPTPEPDRLIGILRVSDLSRKAPQFGEALYPREPQIFLSSEAAAKIRKSAILQDGDLLYSRVGTVGRINEYSGSIWPSNFLDEPDKFRAVASSQIIVIRPSQQISPRFLAGLLSSPLYQEWIASMTSGSVISHITRDDLAAIRVPLAPKPIQSAIAEHLLAGLPLEALSDVLSHGPRADTSLLPMVENSAIRSFSEEIEKGRGSEALKAIAEVFAHRSPEGLLSDWWSNSAVLVHDLVDATEIPNARDRFAALHVWLLNFPDVHRQLKENMPGLRLFESTDSTRETDRLILEAVWRNASKLLDGLKLYAQNEVAALLAAIKVEATVAPAWIPSFLQKVVTVQVMNRSSLSLRDMRVQVHGSSGKSALLIPNAGMEIPITFVPDHLGTHPLLVEWSAKRMDGQRERGSIDLTVEAVVESDSVNLGLGTNPYVDARTLQGEEDRVFFGRMPEIERILAELRKPSASTVLLIEGNRRTGKTSLIHHFQRHHLPDNWVAAYCTFQSGEGAVAEDGPVGRGVPTREVFFILAKAVVEAVVGSGENLNLDGIGVLESTWRPIVLRRRASSLLRPFFDSGPPYEHFRIILEQCLEVLGSRRLLLVIDEFDRLQEGITSGVTSDQVPENIRHLFQSYNQMAGILTGSRKIRRLREEYWNVLFGIGDPVILRGLEEKAVRDLITKPVEGRLTYTPAAVDAIAHLTAGQPRIIQTLCSRLFDLCDQGENTRLITEAMVEQVAEEKARDYEHFKVVWSAIQSPVDQFVAITINDMERSGMTRVSFSLLQDELSSKRLSISQKNLDAALDNLRDLEVIGERITDSTKHYFIEIPLLSRWLLQNQDQERLREDAQNELL